ncbi:glycosyltransferase family 2 protein [Hwangdonia sp.]|uniref:glycosyltransferase family 2 protein n=1 Tax=Hwangdonia sp. TaxID=1883432 RepID=UPI003AB4B7E7
MSLLLTIAIPVYNVAEYVEKCIRSCYSQNIPVSDYEIIIINDGSTDNSLEICKNLQSEFTSLKIITQKNKGLSGARNTGLKHANGEYVWFIDSDDWIEPNCLKDIYSQLKQFKSDILWIGHDVILNDASYRKFIPNAIDAPISGEELFINHLDNLFYIWKFIYKKEFLTHNKLEFLEGIYYEDLEFTPRALIKAKTCFTIPRVFYYYLIRQGSIASLNNIKNKSINDRLQIIEGLTKLKNDKDVSPSYYKKLQDIILEAYITTIKMSARGKLKLPPLAFQLIKKIKSDNYLIGSNKFDFIIMKINLSIYHSFYKTVYAIISKVKGYA